jgi:copper oxidase (laccase) domain-containing protein
MVLRESSSADVLSTAVSMGEVVVIAACVPVLLSSADELT